MPMAAMTLFEVTNLLVTAAAWVGSLVASALTMRSLAPPIDLIPPWRLMRSASSSTPCSEF